MKDNQITQPGLYFDFKQVNLVKVDKNKVSNCEQPKVLLLLNGQSPSQINNLDQYKKIYCTDGAYVKAQDLGLQVDVLVGDFDSHSQQILKTQLEHQNSNFDLDHDQLADKSQTVATKVIYTPDQNFTDFEKCVQVIIQDGYTRIDVYGATGLEHDHFLGNLTTGHKYKDQLTLTFIDDYTYFFFSDHYTQLNGVNDHIVSLYPFPSCQAVTSTGLYYPLEQLDLHLTGQISTRNHANQEQVTITYPSGDMIIFVCRKPKTYITD